MLIALGVCAGLFWFVLAPILAPRGPYVFGRFRLIDIYLGAPLLLTVVGWLVVWAGSPEVRRETAFRTGAVLLSSFLTLIAFDVAWAAWNASQQEALGPFDPELVWVRPAALRWSGRFGNGTRRILYETDENGFRNPLGIREAEIVCVGDSFTEALQVPREDAFCTRLGQLTGGASVNLGRTGYGPQQELIVLRRHALAYRPRVVVWALYEGNDLSDAELYERWRTHPVPIKRSWKSRYVENSLMCAWLARTLPQSKAVLRLRGGGSTTFTLTERRGPEAPEAYPTGAKQLLGALEEGARFCRQHGIQLVVVTLPHYARVLGKDLTPAESPQSSWGAFAKLVEMDCATNEIAFHDLEPALSRRAVLDNSNVYFLGDLHLDAAGHEAVAEEIAEFLRSHPSQLP
jgi:lysophospholipase L1-like esterase